MDLTFAEQVKIVLSRKNMTIKQLAEEIQEKTGHKMSRQNLTQRLGRDNFQEQDMRMIAEILGCPFQLNILDAVDEEEGQEAARPVKKKSYIKTGAAKEAPVKEEVAKEAPVKEEAAKEEPADEHAVTDVTVGDMLDIMESVSEAGISEQAMMEAVSEQAGEPELSAAEQAGTSEPSEAEQAEVTAVSEAEQTGATAGAGAKQTGASAVSEAAQAGASVGSEAEQAGATAVSEAEQTGESEASEQSMEAAGAGAAEKKASGEDHAASKAESGAGQGGHAAEAGVSRETAEQPKPESKKIPKWEPKPEPKKVDRSGIWNRREEVMRRKKQNHPYAEWIGATPQSRSKDFLKDVAETGEINPYTGKEYETNSVRMHPKRIGYIQVYDRGNHKWTDMTEWAFLGFQEQKKNLLGSDYDEPIYLD